jgi:hypothetical protein
MSVKHNRTYSLTSDTIKELDYLAAKYMRSHNGALVYLIHAAYLKEVKRATKVLNK